LGGGILQKLGFRGELSEKGDELKEKKGGICQAKDKDMSGNEGPWKENWNYTTKQKTQGGS